MLKKIICLMSLAIACVAFDSSPAFAGKKAKKATAAAGELQCPVKGKMFGYTENGCTKKTCKDAKRREACLAKCGGESNPGLKSCVAAGGGKKAKKGGMDMKAAAKAAKAKAAAEAAAAREAAEAKAAEEAAAAAAEAPPAEAPVEEAPPADAPPADAPPADAPPAEEAPTEAPPAEEAPPADAPPPEEAPAE